MIEDISLLIFGTVILKSYCIKQLSLAVIVFLCSKITWSRD